MKLKNIVLGSVVVTASLGLAGVATNKIIDQNRTIEENKKVMQMQSDTISGQEATIAKHEQTISLQEAEIESKSDGLAESNAKLTGLQTQYNQSITSLAQEAAAKNISLDTMSGLLLNHALNGCKTREEREAAYLFVDETMLKLKYYIEESAKSDVSVHGENPIGAELKKEYGQGNFYFNLSDPMAKDLITLVQSNAEYRNKEKYPYHTAAHTYDSLNRSLIANGGLLKNHKQTISYDYDSNTITIGE